MRRPTHDERIRSEIETFKGQVNIHDLPDIFHYWSNKFLGPYLAETFGTPNHYQIFAAELIASLKATVSRKIVSVGAGDGSVEIEVAKIMRAEGVEDFWFECLELSPHLIQRGLQAAHEAGVSKHVTFEQIDLNTWKPTRQFGAAFAHHSLHHIVELEYVFDRVRDGLVPGGSFVIADMIGRNGHMRWPETLALIESMWARVPERYKYNWQHQRVIEPYLNWDCSGEGFEGIRAQDILPLLLERFHVHRWAAWGGLLDQFIDRGYGHNFSTSNADDTAFIDDLWAADRALHRLGATTPTQTIAVLKKEPGTLISSDGLVPARCIRKP